MSFDAFPVGTLFNDRYEVLGRVGAGGFGTVLKVRDQEKDQIVALKLTTSFGEDLVRFEREIRLLEKLRDKGIVPILDFELRHTPPFYVMPLADATLEDRAEEMRKDEQTILNVFKEICHPLEAVHAQGVYHRDLKPSNVLILGDQIVVSDFGIARSAVSEGTTLTQGAMGDPQWCAPEQLTTVGTKDADARTDVYQLGKLLYWLYTGETPFHMELDRLPAGIEKIVAGATMKAKDDRFANVKSLLHAVAVYEHMMGDSTRAEAEVTGAPSKQSVAISAEAALYAVRNEQKDAKAKVRAFSESIGSEVALLNQGYSPEFQQEGFFRRVEDTLPIAFSFARLANAVAELEDRESAIVLYKGFEHILKGYYLPRGVGGHFDWREFDLPKFVGYELFVSLFAALIREERWELIADLLDDLIFVENPSNSDAPRLMPYTYVWGHVNTLIKGGEETRGDGGSQIADVIRKRHSEGELAAISPFTSFMEADYFLYLRSVVALPPGEHEADWLPRSAAFLHQPPRYILESVRGRYAARLLRPLGSLATLDDLRALLTRAKTLRVPGFYFRRNPLHNLDTNQIPGSLV